MLVIGCDYHPGFQQIAYVDTESGECGERRLAHREEAEQFYGTLRECSVRVGMEASGHGRWFERLLRELQFELWIGDWGRSGDLYGTRLSPVQNGLGSRSRSNTFCLVVDLWTIALRRVSTAVNRMSYLNTVPKP